MLSRELCEKIQNNFFLNHLGKSSCSDKKRGFLCFSRIVCLREFSLAVFCLIVKQVQTKQLFYCCFHVFRLNIGIHSHSSSSWNRCKTRPGPKPCFFVRRMNIKVGRVNVPSIFVFIPSTREYGTKALFVFEEFFGLLCSVTLQTALCKRRITPYYFFHLDARLLLENNSNVLYR